VARDNQLAFRSMVAQIYEFRAMLKSASLESGGITIAAQHTLAASTMPAFLARLRTVDPNQSFRIRSENRTESVSLLMRGEAEILLTYEAPQFPCQVPEPFAVRHVLGKDDLVLVAAPSLHRQLSQVAEGDPVPMLCFPPESFFGEVIRAEALPALMRRQQVVVRCVSEFAMGLRELALAGEGAVWLPSSLIRQDLQQRTLRPLSRLGAPVRLDIVVFFAMLDDGRGERLRRAFVAEPGDSTDGGGG
jgi:LysR family transcriptional regulator, hypochlorite-specific transcription factor HypT